jgi:hypothetical protein
MNIEESLFVRNICSASESAFAADYTRILPVFSLFYAVYAYNNRIGFCHDELWDYIPAVGTAKRNSSGAFFIAYSLIFWARSI